MKKVVLLAFLAVLIQACYASWECTYEDYLGIETTKTCYGGCCEHDCCSSVDGKAIGFSIGGVVSFSILVTCCCIFIRRRRQAGVIVVGGAPQANLTVVTTTNASAPVPQHQGYDQPGYQPSQFPRPPAYKASS